MAESPSGPKCLERGGQNSFAASLAILGIKELDLAQGSVLGVQCNAGAMRFLPIFLALPGCKQHFLLRNDKWTHALPPPPPA